jgi:hypothetical protein
VQNCGVFDCYSRVPEREGGRGMEKIEISICGSATYENFKDVFDGGQP